MESPSLDSTDDAETDEKTGLRSGTGAPIFEHGPTTRIRRNPVRAIAALTWDGGPRRAFGQLVDVSLTGCLLKTETTIPRETEIEMSVSLLGTDDSTEYDVRAVVRRLAETDGRRGYGLEFLTDSTQERRAVQALYSSTAG